MFQKIVHELNFYCLFDAIALLTSKLYNALDKSKPTTCVFLGLANAFDIVSHQQLLEVLEGMGLGE